MPPWEGVRSLPRVCCVCDSGFLSKRPSAKYCSQFCCDKARYERSGQRAGPEQRARWYRNRVEDPQYVEKLREQGRVRFGRVQEFLRAHKLKHGCADCGFSAHHAALHFDHISGEKEFNVCNAKSIAQAKREMAKCEVVCANCHSIRSFERLQCKPDIFAATYEPVPDDA